MKQIRWNLIKNQQLKAIRGVSFDEIIHAKLIAVKKHLKKQNQKIMLFEYQNYIWVVPYVENKEMIFLKTLFQSRKYTKLYKRGELL